MSKLQDLATYLAVLEKNRGASTWRDIRDWYEHFASAEAVIVGRCPEGLDGMYGDKPVRERPAPADIDRVTRQLEQLSEQGIQVLTTLDEAYPENLRTAYDRPPFLFARGTVPRHPRCVAVVGSRKATNLGLLYAKRLSESLVSREYCVVSGLAEGIDTEAHRAALNKGGETLAVIGTPITRAYPAKNKKLQEEIATRGGLVSQFLLDEQTGKHSFPMRNRVMSGLSLATVVVEANNKSGTRSQAEGALKHDRLVFFTKFALAGADWARKMVGRAGVHVIEGPDDLYGPLEARLSPPTCFEDLDIDF